MARSNWPEWIRASFNKRVAAALTGKHIYYEAQTIRQTNTQTNYFEARFNGPNITGLSNDVVLIEAVLNILVATTPTENMYKHEQNVGLALAVFTDEIELFKAGQAQPDTSLGCIRLIDGAKITNYGVHNQGVDFIMSSVEGRYRTQIKESDW